MSGWTRLKSRRNTLLIGCLLEICCVWLIFRGLQMGHAMVKVVTSDGSNGDPGYTVVHEYMQRSTATPMLYWGSLAAIAVIALLIGYSLVMAIRSGRRAARPRL